MTEQAHRNRDTITDIRGRMLRGVITYEEAQAEAKPVIDAMNKRSAEIAKENDDKFRPLSFKSLMR